MLQDESFVTLGAPPPYQSFLPFQGCSCQCMTSTSHVDLDKSYVPISVSCVVLYFVLYRFLHFLAAFFGLVENRTCAFPSTSFVLERSSMLPRTSLISRLWYGILGLRRVLCGIIFLIPSCAAFPLWLWHHVCLYHSNRVLKNRFPYHYFPHYVFIQPSRNRP